ncbi:MAG: tetratricopeptide repeat protein, partial [Candidatus Sumerlaeia bacterium]|nr:tetratricopeptide repeat protein [Candidatus Sumerlaeia bacterium]
MKFRVIFIILIISLVIAGIATGFIYLSLREKQKTVLEQLLTAEKAVNDKKYDEAKEKLKTLLEHHPRSIVSPRVYYLLARVSYETGDLDTAFNYSETLLAKYPESEYSVWAKYYKGDILLQRDKNNDEALTILEDLSRQNKNITIANLAEYSRARAMSELGKLKEAKAKLMVLYTKEQLPEELKEKIETLLGKVNIDLLFSPQLEEGDQLYELKKGDTIWDLKRKFKVTEELLLRCNNITNEKMLKIGRKIKIPGGKFSVLVDKTSNTLTLERDGKFFKKYRVRTGKYDYLTPAGEYKIEFKKKNPEWVDPRTNKRYPPNDPNNELGTRWMAFKGSALGIHGTIHPETIGQYASYG